MYLFPRGTSRIYSRAAYIHPMYRYGVTAGVLGLILVCWWFCIYRPLERIITGYGHHNNALRTQCATAVNDTQSLRALQAAVGQLKTDRVLDGTTVVKPWVAAVMELASQTGVSITAYHADPVCLKDWYSCTRARFDFVGNLPALRTFLAQLRTSIPSLGCKQWSIRSSGTGGVYAFSGTFNLVSFTPCACGTEKKPLQLTVS